MNVTIYCLSKDQFFLYKLLNSLSTNNVPICDVTSSIIYISIEISNENNALNFNQPKKSQ